MRENDLVWYACYGTNMSEERLKYYIRGGVYPVNGVRYRPCTDTSLWRDTMVRTYPGRMYFSNHSPSWQEQGVAFFDRNGDGETVMKLYLITWGQFLDIQEREGAHHSWYGKIEQLDELDGIPVMTMTSARPHRNDVAPLSQYVEVIRSALTQECGMTTEEAEQYLNRCMMTREK